MPEIWRGIAQLEDQDNEDGNHVHNGNHSVIQNALMTLNAGKALSASFGSFVNISFLDSSGGFVSTTDLKPKFTTPASWNQSSHSISGEMVGKPDICCLASSQVPEDPMVNRLPVRPSREKPPERQNQDHVQQGICTRSCNDWSDDHGDKGQEQTTQSEDSVKPWAKTVMKHGEALHTSSASEAFVASKFQLPSVTNMASPLPSSVMSALAVFDVTHPTTTLFQMADYAVWLDAPLKDFMNESDLPTSAVEQPACDQVFSDGEFRESTNVDPSSMSNDEATAWTPSCIYAVTSTIISPWTSHICLIQRIVVRNVVVMLLLVSLYYGQELYRTTHLCTCHHANPIVDQDMRKKSTEDTGFRNHVSIEDSLELSRLVQISDGGVEVASLVTMVLFSLDTSPVVEIVVFYLDAFTGSPQLYVVAIIGKDDAESVSGVVDLESCFHRVEDNVSWLAT